MADAGHVAWDMERFQFLDEAGRVRQHSPVAAPPVQAEQQLRALRSHPGHLPGPRLRPLRHHLRPRQDRLDRLRPACVGRSGARGMEAVPGACRRGPARLGGDLFAHACATTGAACAASSTRRMCGPGRSRSSRPSTSWTSPISENVYAGNAMNRRLFYQYGLLLPASPHGYVGQGLGQGVSAGADRPDRADALSSRRTSRRSRSTASG